jgi:vacuolar-type H+-ATPase subunit F/Vma7
MTAITDSDAQRLLQEVDTATTVDEVRNATWLFCEAHDITVVELPDQLAERISDRVREIREDQPAERTRARLVVLTPSRETEQPEQQDGTATQATSNLRVRSKGQP